MKIYTVKPGESIGDVVMNSTGSLLNWDAVLTANGFTDWTPTLFAGQVLTIPDNVQVDANTRRQLQSYPACNNISTDIFGKIEIVFSLIRDYWILSTSFWNDNAVWKDYKSWLD